MTASPLPEGHDVDVTRSGSRGTETHPVASARTQRLSLEGLIEAADRPLLVLALGAVALYLLELRGVIASAGPARVVSAVIDAFFITDVLLKVAVIRKRYLRSAWLVTDVLSCVPGISLLANVPWLMAVQFTRMFRILRVLRGLRVLRSLQFMPSLARLAGRAGRRGKKVSRWNESRRCAVFRSVRCGAHLAAWRVRLDAGLAGKGGVFSFVRRSSVFGAFPFPDPCRSARDVMEPAQRSSQHRSPATGSRALSASSGSIPRQAPGSRYYLVH